jgi:hypothetical protein
VRDRGGREGAPRTGGSGRQGRCRRGHRLGDPHVGGRGAPSSRWGTEEKYGRSKQAGVSHGGGARASGCVTSEIFIAGGQARCGPRRPASQPFPGCPVGLSSCFFVIGSLVSYSCTRQATVWLAWHRIQFLSFFPSFFIASKRTRCTVIFFKKISSTARESG